MSQNWEMEQGAREIIREQEEKIKRSREQREMKKGAVKIGKKMQVPKNGREQGEQGKMSEGSGSKDPPNRATLKSLHFKLKTNVLNFGAICQGHDKQNYFIIVRSLACNCTW